MLAGDHASLGPYTSATASAMACQYPSRAAELCSIWMPPVPLAVRRLTMLRGLLPPNSSSGCAMLTAIPEPATARPMASATSRFKELGAAPPMRMPSLPKPWKATAYPKPREMTRFSLGKLAGWMSVEVTCQHSWALSPRFQPLHRYELAPLAESRSAMRSGWSSSKAPRRGR